MKIKNRIFISNTIMVLVSLVTLLAISGTLVNLFENEYKNIGNTKARVDKNAFLVQTLMEQSSDVLLDYEALSKRLSEYDYQLCVRVKDEIKFSNLGQVENDIKDFMKSSDFIEKHAVVYHWDSITFIGKSIQVGNDTYSIVAVHGENKDEWFGAKRSQFEIFIMNYIIIGIVVIVVLLGISQLFTKRLVKCIMNPVGKLTNAAKRIEEGNLKEPIVYVGEDEFETVCTSFNAMQSHLLEEQKKNAGYEKARTDMISGISHDLRTPLTSVKGYIKGLKDGVANTLEKQNQYLDIAYAKSCEMDVLLQRLFYFSKMETGNMPFYTQKADLAEFIRKFVEGSKKELEAKQANISFDAAKGVHTVAIDIEQMQRVLSNLVENSLKYSNTDFLELKISLTQEDSLEVIEVSDNGIGVVEEKLPHLFEQFYRGDESRSKNNNEGNGLGLYIAKYIVEAHGGTITATNDQGLKVILSLPRRREDVQ